MNLLNALHQLLGGHPSVGRVVQGMPHAQGMHPLQYAQYMNRDGTGGGYGPNNPSQLQVRPQQAPANLGVPYGGQPQLGNPGRYPQPGQYNPGFTPLQNSGFGPGGSPQIGAFQLYQQSQRPQFNPQDNSNQQYWQQ